MADLVAGQKKGGLTFAPEAGTQRLRDVINKNVTEDDLFGAVDAAFSAGWRRCKLYFMIGLPTETDDDVKGIARLVQQVYDRAKAIVPKEQKGSIQISASVALFVPKSHTPFQWCGQIPPEEALRRVNLLRHSVKYRAITVNWHDPKTSFVEAVMSRSGREAAAVVEEAWKRGARFDAWSECFREDAWRDAADALDFDVERAAQASYPVDYVMPWDHISCGASVRWLAREHDLALEGQTTPDCTFGPCSACGVCMNLNAKNMLASSRSSVDEAGEVSDKLIDIGQDAGDALASGGGACARARGAPRWPAVRDQPGVLAAHEDRLRVGASRGRGVDVRDLRFATHALRAAR